jgi:hypothetical protein
MAGDGRRPTSTVGDSCSRGVCDSAAPATVTGRCHPAGRFCAATRALELARINDAAGGARGGECRHIRSMLGAIDSVLFSVEDENLRQSIGDTAVGGERPLPAGIRRAVMRALQTVASHLQCDSAGREQVAGLVSEASSHAPMAGLRALDLLFSTQATLLELLDRRNGTSAPRRCCSDGTRNVSRHGNDVAATGSIAEPSLVPARGAMQAGAAQRAV